MNPVKATNRDYYRKLTGVAVLIVAGIAATVSYLHISHLALAYGQPRLSAYLMPLSVDGLVSVSSLAMLRSARSGLTTGGLARVGLALGVLATIGANVASGLPHGVIGAVIAGWPAAAFIVAVEIAIGMVRRKPVKTPISVPATSTQTVNAETPDMTNAGHDINPVTSPRLARMARQETTARTAVLANPQLSLSELAALLGTSERTARRVLARVGPTDPAPTGPLVTSGAAS